MKESDGEGPRPPPRKTQSRRGALLGIAAASLLATPLLAQTWGDWAHGRLVIVDNTANQSFDLNVTAAPEAALGKYRVSGCSPWPAAARRRAA